MSLNLLYQERIKVVVRLENAAGEKNLKIGGIKIETTIPKEGKYRRTTL